MKAEPYKSIGSIAPMIKIYIAHQITFTLLAWVPIFYEVQIRFGLQSTEIFQIQTLYYICFLFLDLPTGFLADRWGRKKVIILGSTILIAANLWPIFFHSFSGFLTHFVLIALSRSLISGCASAYLYDFLAFHGQESHYKDIEGKARSFSLVTRVLAFALAGLLVQYYVWLPYWLSATSSLLALGFALILPQLKTVASSTLAKAPEKTTPDPNIKLKNVFLILINSPSTLLSIILGVVLAVAMRISEVNLFQPLLKEHQLPVWSFGILLAIMTAAEAFAAYNAQKIKITHSQQALFTSLIVICLSLVGLAQTSLIVTLFSLVFFACACGIAYPLQKQILNNSIKHSELRASLLSLDSFFARLGCALSAWYISDQIKHVSIRQVFFTFSIVFFCITMWVLVEWRRAHEIKILGDTQPLS